MPPLDQTVRVDYVLDVIRTVLEEALSNVLPADRFILGPSLGTGSAPRPPRPYVWLDLITLPNRFNSFTDETQVREAIGLGRVVIVSAASGRGYKLRVNGLPAKYTALPADSVTDIRDGLIQSVIDLGEDVVTNVIAADEFTVDPGSLGSLYSITTPTGSDLLTLTTEDYPSPVFAEYVLGDRSFTARFQVYSESDKVGSAGAHAISNILFDALEAPNVRVRFKDSRIAVLPINSPSNLTGISLSDSNIEQRASFDIQITFSALSVHDAYPIETVEIDFTVNGETVPIVIS